MPPHRETTVDPVNQFKETVEQYRALHRREGLPDFDVSGLYDLFPKTDPRSDTAHHWPDDWPNAGRAGVYAVFADDRELLYVGKSSMNSFLAARLGAYFGYAPDRSCRIKNTWVRAPRFLVTVGVPDDSTWEAPALEEFLIQKLNPPLNRNGRSK